MTNEKTRILFVSSSLKRSGPVHQLLNLVAVLARENYAPSVLTLSPESADSLWWEFVGRGIPTRTLGLSRIRGMLIGKRKLQSMIRSLRPNILHTTGIRADRLGACCIRTLPCVATLHTNPDNDYVSKFGPWKGPLMAHLHWRALERLAAVAAVSEEIATLAQRRGVNAVAIHNGVDMIRYRPPTAEERVAARRRCGIAPDCTVLVSVGALIPLKDPLTVIRAFRRAKQGQLWTLVMLGDGPLRQECKREAGGDPSIQLTGQVPNVAEYLRMADYFVSASTSEGIPYAVLEALACGLPVCLSDIAAHRAILQAAVGAGLIFPAGDTSSLAKRMATLLREGPAIRREHVLRGVASEFSADVMGTRYRAFYGSLRAVRSGSSEVP